jgi:aspartate aminotransferase-like enzyme
MSKLYPSIDPEGLVEYSVVYTDRSLNHMSQSFQGVMKNISRTLKQVYNAQAVAVVRAAAHSAWKRWRDSLPPASNAW